MLNHQSKRARITAIGCAVAAASVMGCRGGSPRLNLFSWNSEPSADVIAGTGPTTTYPPPPSAIATPSAIESIAAGVEPPNTALAAGPGAAAESAASESAAKANPADVASRPTGTPGPTGSTTAPRMPGFESGIPGLDIDAGRAELPPAANLAAAEANGFYGAAPGAPSTTATPADSTPTPSATPSYSMPSLASGGSASGPATVAASNNAGDSSSRGYSLPPDLDFAAKASAAAETKPTPEASTDPATASGTDESGTRVASASNDASSTAEPAPVQPTSGTTAPKTGGYAPGSTSGGSAYPHPGGGGSIFR